jgi:hypothetical protein
MISARQTNPTNEIDKALIVAQAVEHWIDL